MTAKRTVPAMILISLFLVFIFFIVKPVYALPAPIDGTFIYLGYGNQDLKTELIPAFVDELQKLRFSTIIIGSVQAKDQSTGCNGNTYHWYGDLPQKLDTIMAEATKHNIDVYFGLTETSGECYPPYTEPNKTNILSYLADGNNPNNPIVYVINKYSSNTNFKGWYIPDEPGLGWWSDTEVAASYSYYAGYVNAIRKFSNKTILTAPSLAGATARTPQNFANMVYSFKNNTGITSFVWQDSVGEVGMNVDWRNSSTSKDYYAAIAAKIGKDNLWSDLELGNCCVSPAYVWDTGAYNPASIARILAQLTNSPPEYTAKRIVWIQQYQMSEISSWRKTGAHRLLASYKSIYGIEGEYLKPLSYTWITPPEPAYPDTNNSELFDMKTADPLNYLDPRWVDVVGSPSVLVDLGNLKYIRWIGIHLLHQTASGIYFPDSMTFTCSADNSTWTPPVTWNLPVRKADSEFVFSNPNNEPINKTCRYIKVTLNKSGWHTFMSEMEIVANPQSIITPTPSPTSPPTPSCASAGPTSNPTILFNQTSYTVYAYGVANTSIVTFYVWSKVNNQTDMQTISATNMGGGTWKATINMTLFSATGQYYADVYLSNNFTYFCGGAPFIRAATPTITPTRTPTMGGSPTPTRTPTPGSSPTPAPSTTPNLKPGDANGDGRIDGLDYIVWLNHFNQTTSAGPTAGDFNRSGKVDGLDYVVWLNNFGT